MHVTEAPHSYKTQPSARPASPREIYTAYKDSGVEWLGEIPEHWEVKRLKYASTYMPSNVDKNTADDEVPVHLCNYTDVYYNETITSELPLMKATATINELEKFKLINNDVVITKDSESPGDIAVPAFVPYDLPGVVCGYHLAILRPKVHSVEGKYVYYLLKSSNVSHQFYCNANGITRYAIIQSGLNRVTIPLPPLVEQKAIAAFLDRETEHMDNLIERKEDFIRLQEEKRSALISHAVTRGLSELEGLPRVGAADVKFKDSGVEWLVEIPEHWEVLRQKHLWKSCDYGLSESLSGNGTVKVLTMGHISNGYVTIPESGCIDYCPKEMLLNSGDLLFNRTNSLAHVGKVGLYTTENNDPVSFASYLVRIRVNEKSTPEYLIYLLNTASLLNFVRELALPSINQANLNPNRYGQISIPLPPLPEQKAIAAFLDLETTRIDTIIRKTKESIELLKEKRSALISAAVTGQIKVPGVA